MLYLPGAPPQPDDGGLLSPAGGEVRRHAKGKGPEAAAADARQPVEPRRRGRGRAVGASRLAHTAPPAQPLPARAAPARRGAHLAGHRLPSVVAATAGSGTAPAALARYCALQLAPAAM